MSDAAIQEYLEITPYGYIKDENVYLRGYHGFQDREIGVVRESNEASLEYFINRFEMVKKKVLDVKASIESAENKGSYLMKLIHMRTYLATYNGLGDFESLYKIINELEDEIEVYVQKNREKNYDIKKSLLSEAETVRGSTDWKYGTEKLKELKLNWIKTGSAHKEVEDDLSRRFNDALEYFFSRRKNFLAEQAKITRDRLYKYKRLLDELKRINRQGGDAIHSQRVKDIQREWKEVGKVPMKKFQRTNSDFKREASYYFNKLKAQRETQKPKSAIETKRDLYGSIEKMLNSRGPFNINTVKSIQNTWKSFGKLPDQEDRELNLKFRIACNEIFETYFLEKSAKYFNQDLYSKPPHEQARIKMDLLNDSIRKDQDDLNAFNQENAYELSSRNVNPSLLQQRNNFINRLKTKQRILKKLEDQLYS